MPQEYLQIQLILNQHKYVNFQGFNAHHLEKLSRSQDQPIEIAPFV